MGAQCAMVAHSSLLGSVGSLLPIQVDLKDLRDSPFQWTFMTGMFPIHGPDNCIRSLWRAPRHSAQGPHWPIIMSICTKLQNKEPVIEALCRAKFKFPGCQKSHISKKQGLIKCYRDEFEIMVSNVFLFLYWTALLPQKQLIPDGCGVGWGKEIKYIPNCGPLDKWRVSHAWQPYSCPPINPTFLSKKKSP